MPAATASGADANGSARNRDHKQGNQGRSYTVEQKAAVIRVRRCAHTAYYEILSLEKAASESEVKKAYRKLSLLTHPDKNGYDGADEAFKMVSRAFQVLSDPDKKSKFDRFGGDPDSRFGGGAEASSPFSGFARSQGGGRGPMFEEEISPEELFNRFFSGGGGGFGPFGNDMFGGGSQFVFNMGGGPGFRVHQFGGQRPRRRPRDANAGPEEPQTASSLLRNLLPLIILFILPLLSSLYQSSTAAPPGPQYRFENKTPYTMSRTTNKYKLNYFLNPNDVLDYTNRKFHQLDLNIEQDYLRALEYECRDQRQTRERMMQEAQGWLFPDTEKMLRARKMELKSCNRLREIGALVGGWY